MSDPHMQSPSQEPADDASSHAARAEALSWLASRYRWEQLLEDLHEVVERESGVVKLRPPSRCGDDRRRLGA
jgi:hypothetical protein